MTAPVLKSTLATDGLAFLASDYSEPGTTLYEVLKAIIKTGAVLTARQAAAATGILFRYSAQQDGVLGDFTFTNADSGSSGTSTVIVKKNGSAVAGATLSIGNAATNGTIVSLDLSTLAGAPFVKGDVLTIEVSAIAVAATDLDVALHLRPASIATV